MYAIFKHVIKSIFDFAQIQTQHNMNKMVGEPQLEQYRDSFG